MKEDAIKKVNKIGQIGSIIALIMRIVLIVALVVCILGTIAVVVLPDNLVNLQVTGEAIIDIDVSELNREFSEEDITKIKDNMLEGDADVDINGLNYDIYEVNVDEEGFTMNAGATSRLLNFDDLLGILVIAIVTLIFSIITVSYARGLCKAFSVCLTPFEEDIIKSMQKLAYSLIPWALFSSATESIANTILSKNISIFVGVDLGVIFVIVIIFVLVQIFKYGAVLQQESDETL